MPYMLSLADKGAEKAMRENKALLCGLNTYGGMVTYRAVAESMKMEYIPAEKCL
jgi:alanine dehydrogenase